MVLLQCCVFMLLSPAVGELLGLQNLILVASWNVSIPIITPLINQPVGTGKYQSVMKDPSACTEGYVLALLKCSHELWHETIL